MLVMPTVLLVAGMLIMPTVLLMATVLLVAGMLIMPTVLLMATVLLVVGVRGGRMPDGVRTVHLNRSTALPVPGLVAGTVRVLTAEAPVSRPGVGDLTHHLSSPLLLRSSRAI